MPLRRFLPRFLFDFAFCFNTIWISKSLLDHDSNVADGRTNKPQDMVAGDSAMALAAIAGKVLSFWDCLFFFWSNWLIRPIKKERSMPLDLECRLMNHFH